MLSHVASMSGCDLADEVERSNTGIDIDCKPTQTQARTAITQLLSIGLLWPLNVLKTVTMSRTIASPIQSTRVS